MADDLPWLLARAAFSLGAQLADALDRELGTTPRTYAVLAGALDADLTQKALADAVGLDKTTMVVALDELQEAGLITREPSAADRRVRLVRPTAAGRDLVARARPVVERVQDAAFADLGPTTRATVRDALRRLVTTSLSAPLDCAPTRSRPRRPRGR
jgi:DNA-binding MarR family transcriptional regulator